MSADKTFTDVALQRPSLNAGDERAKEPSTEGDVSSSNTESSVAQLDGYSHGFKLLVIVGALLLSIFLVALDMTIVATAIPKITDDFHSIDQVGWYGSAFFLTLAVFQSFWGKIYRYCDLKFAFIIAGFIFELGSLICGVSKNSVGLIVGRAITGWGAAGLFGGAYTIVAFIAPLEKRPVYTGLIGTAYAAASVAGPLLGGVFTDTISWRWCFFINLPIGGLSLGLMLLFLKLPASAKPVPAPMREILLQLDISGIVTVLIALVCFLLVTEWAGVIYAWNSAPVIVCLVVSAIMMLGFIALQSWQAERASIVPRIFMRRGLIGVCTFAFFQNGTNFLITYYLPLYFQAIDNVSAAKSGIYNLPLIVGSCLCAALSGYLITKVGYYTPFMVFGSMIFTIGAGLLYTLDNQSRLAKAIGYQVLLGVGQGVSIQMPVIVGQALSPPTDMSATTAIVLFFQMLGGTVFISAGQSTFANRLLIELHRSAPQVDATKIVAIGASELRQQVPADQIALVLDAYMVGIRDTFALGIAAAGGAFLSSWIAPIMSIKALSPALEVIQIGV